jgi:hypothetical protein
MTSSEIRAAIAARPELAEALAARNDVALADALSQGRKRLAPTLITERKILSVLGPVAGGATLKALEDFAAQTLPAEHPLYAAHAGIARAVRWLKDADGIDVGDASTQTMLGTFAALGVITAEAAAAVQALGYVDDPVPVAEVSAALNEV